MPNTNEVIAKYIDTPFKGPGRPRLSQANVTTPYSEVATAFDEIIATGAEGIAAILERLHDIDDGKDSRARYFFHGICIYCCREGKKQERAMVIQATLTYLAAAKAKGQKAFAIRELEHVGDKSCVAAVGKYVTDDELCPDAVRTLVSIGEGAAEQLRAALPSVKGRNLAHVVSALGRLGDTTSAAAIRQAAADTDVDVRVVAYCALASIGDATAIDLLLKASDTQDWERIQATKACLVLAEKLTAAGNKADAAKIYKHLQETRTEPHEEYVRDIAAAALK